jgi:hypothetical protein
LFLISCSKKTRTMLRRNNYKHTYKCFCFFLFLRTENSFKTIIKHAFNNFSLFLIMVSGKGYSDFQHFLYSNNELTTDKHLFCQSLFRNQSLASHYMASVWSFLLVEHSITIV